MALADSPPVETQVLKTLARLWEIELPNDDERAKRPPHRRRRLPALPGPRSLEPARALGRMMSEAKKEAGLARWPASSGLHRPPDRTICWNDATGGAGRHGREAGLDLSRLAGGDRRPDDPPTRRCGPALRHHRLRRLRDPVPRPGPGSALVRAPAQPRRRPRRRPAGLRRTSGWSSFSGSPVRSAA